MRNCGKQDDEEERDGRKGGERGTEAAGGCGARGAASAEKAGRDGARRGEGRVGEDGPEITRGVGEEASVGDLKEASEDPCTWRRDHGQGQSCNKWEAAGGNMVGAGCEDTES